MSRRTSRASFGRVSVALPPPGRLLKEPEQENRRDDKGKVAAVPKGQPHGGVRKSTIPKPQPKRSVAPSRPPLKPTEPQPRPSAAVKRTSSFGTGSGRLTMGGAAALERRG